ncbi:uncharacterized protein ATNIH1004_011689 [Aspergillus tanneri]|uniref:Ubiquitin 3 binding protein But2 C-terminal domain-containing protein n=1 Tax=Aspergillus tanneri TaxID=1220188 RepID=A0A5M9M9G9_9EURO|nr:uncharacterized protein ATNIH1004_011689 [Aspergillus tanneri]KAA8641553.1 hypothetical protein ATNIH1004_011689 [Aspergillus tanneri]
MKPISFAIILTGLIGYSGADSTNCAAAGLELIFTPGQMTQIGGVPLDTNLSYATLTFDDLPRIINFPPFHLANCSAGEDLIQQVSLSPYVPSGSGKLTFTSSNVTCYSVLVVPPALSQRRVRPRVTENQIASVCSKNNYRNQSDASGFSTAVAASTWTSARITSARQSNMASASSRSIDEGSRPLPMSSKLSIGSSIPLAPPAASITSTTDGSRDKTKDASPTNLPAPIASTVDSISSDSSSAPMTCHCPDS